MKTANELHAIADAVNAEKEEARKAQAKEKAEAMVLDCEVEAKKGRHFCKFNRYHNIVNEELIIDELKAHNYEVIIEGCYLMIRW